MFNRFCILIVTLCALTYAQDSTLNNVHTFQTFLKDAPITTTPYAEAGFNFSTYNYGKLIALGVQGGYPINPQFEIGGHFGFQNNSPNEGDGNSGVTDITLAGRYNLLPTITNISAGAYLTLPVGSEETGYGNFDFGVFGALRHPLQNGIVVTGTVGLDFVERINGRDVASHIAAGGIIPVNPQLNIISELNFRTDFDYILLSAGGDYLLNIGGRVRGALGVGLQDGAPDFMIIGGYLHTF